MSGMFCQGITSVMPEVPQNRTAYTAEGLVFRVLTPSSKTIHVSREFVDGYGTVRFGENHDRASDERSEALGAERIRIRAAGPRHHRHTHASTRRPAIHARLC